ncbi:hypothetical protein TTHERM_00264760 (macronuclear) [Tetrahymena thermophila SB210]|uniref:Uncharacterized protein n=1 Tax=Tetrahymena thermophila (strain SB210) TaxID=312017 RepID=Q22U06_TETTS|nr:hypothetical protein TTHERM_00264760 [Tetrahymena thermophila SB210]EAR88881.2 hypothetical protein TTHERM_00264760 [Tetrahymena thermophila SB210]|eukprot:XP_001009126.2 hypothetical protein TTHERM_00264760 [Tetrahymena thermophila SB210]
MICKQLVQNLVKQPRQFSQLFHSLRYFKSNQQLTYTSQQSFINLAMYSDINEKFTEEEMELQSQFKDIEDEMDSVHKNNYTNTLESTQENLFSNNNSLLGFDANSTLKEDNQEEHQQEEAKKIDVAYRMPLSMSFQVAMQKVENAYSAQDKLQIVQQYCLLIRSQINQINLKQREFLMQLVMPIVKNINQDPSKHNQNTLYALFNISREDFLNFHLSNKVLLQIKNQVQKNYESFELDKIKQVFYASCMKHKDNTLQIVEPVQLRFWFQKIYQKILENPQMEREMILFMTYYHKDSDLFRKTHKFITHSLVSDYNQNVLLRSQNPELLKVFVSIFSKNEKGTPQLHQMFYISLCKLITSQKLSVSQFQVILRNLLRSQNFLSSRVITSYEYDIQIPLQSSDQVSESDGEKSESVAQDQDKETPKNKENESMDTQWQILSQDEVSFKIIDQFIMEKLSQMSSNQILNVLNLYQLINAQNYRESVIKILDQLKSTFNSNCDNHFSFIITVRTLCLFNIENPEQYLSVYKSSPQKLIENNFTLQMSQIFTLVKEFMPQVWNQDYEASYALILHEIKKDQFKINLNYQKSQQYLLTHIKKKNINLVENVLTNLNITYLQQSNVETFYVDFFIKSSNQNTNQNCKLPAIPFTLDVISAREEMAPEVFNSSIALKQMILNKLNVPYVQLKQEFFVSIYHLDFISKQNAIIKEINNQLQKYL